MSKQSDDFRAYLGSLFDDESTLAGQENNTVETEPQVEHEDNSSRASQTSDAAQLSADELFQQGAQAAQEQRRLRDLRERKEKAKEAAAWLENSVRDEDSDSSHGFDFLDESEDPRVVAPLDTWPAFTDIDKDNVVIRYGAPESSSADADQTDTMHTKSVADSAQEAESEATDEPSTRRFAGRFLGAIVVLGLAGGAAYGISREHSENSAMEAPAYQGTPISAQLACPGTFERTLDVGVNVTDVDERINDSALLVATGNAHIDDKRVLLPSPQRSADSSDTAGEIAGIGTVSMTRARGIFSADDTDTQLAGGNFHRADAGDMRGLASVACLSGQVDSYLVGSQISVGTSNDLVLVNLSSAPTTVNLEALGSSGFLQASSVENIVVDAHATKRVSLDGAIDGDDRLALHISAPTGEVAAFVQETVLDGAKPAGISWISPAPASQNLIIPAVSIAEDSVDFPRVRVANFEDTPATVTLSLRSHEGDSVRDDLHDITVAARSVIDIPLDGIESGLYSVVVASSSPVSAGVELSYRQTDDSPRDIAWASAVAPSYESMGVIGDVTAMMVLAGETNGTATVHFYDKSGEHLDTHTVEISGTHSAVVNVPTDTVAVRVSADIPIAAGIIGQVALDQGLALDWLPLASRPDDVSNQRVSLW